MSVIAWDGKTLAADKRSVCSGIAATTTKIRRIVHDGCTTGSGTSEVLAWTGDQDAGEMLAKWYSDGADPEKWPEFPKDKDMWCRLIVADGNGARFYERMPIAVRVEDAFMAWGSGRDFALAAMYLGKSAREAVKIACVFDTGCGNGIDAFELTP